MNALPTSWEAYVQGLRAVMDSKQLRDYNGFKGKVFEEYKVRREGKETGKVFKTLEEKGKLPTTGKFKGSCHNCGKTGHKNDKCWAKGGGAEGKGPQGRVNSAKTSWVFGAKHLAAGKEEDRISSRSATSRQKDYSC